jgi:hypothetical protein
MNDINSTSNVLDFAEGERPKLPQGLNVLTILTFIGSALAIIGAIWNFTNAEKGYKNLLAAQDKMAEAPAWAKGMMGPEMLEMAKKAMENKLPMLLLGLAGAALCIYGALEMRKLKKQGFILWLVGEILPIVAGVIFVGTGMFGGFSLVMMIFPAIFIILYVVQRKYLVY